MSHTSIVSYREDLGQQFYVDVTTCPCPIPDTGLPYLSLYDMQPTLQGPKYMFSDVINCIGKSYATQVIYHWI